MIPRFPAKYSENHVFNFAIIYKKEFVSKKCCIAHHKAQTWFFSNCRCHALTQGNVEDLLQKLDPLCSQINTRTASLHSSMFGSVERLLSRAAKCSIKSKNQSALFEETEMWTECPVSGKRNSWGKSGKLFLNSFQRAKLTQTSGSVFGKGTEQVKKSKNMSWNYFKL